MIELALIFAFHVQITVAAVSSFMGGMAQNLHFPVFLFHIQLSYFPSIWTEELIQIFQLVPIA